MKLPIIMLGTPHFSPDGKQKIADDEASFAWCVLVFYLQVGRGINQGFISQHASEHYFLSETERDVNVFL